MELHFPVILDGANGTELQKRGMPAGVCSEQWIIDNPQAMIDLQRGYASAGSDIVYAPTFTATENKLAEHGITGRVYEYNKRLVEISAEAVGESVLVAGDMSPVGKFLKPFGDATFEDMYNLYYEQASALEAAGVDLFVCETMTSVPEARAAVIACRTVSRKPVVVSFTCDDRGRTLTGSDVCAAAQIMEGLGVAAVGLNCSFGPDAMLEQLRKLSEYTSLPLLAKPNAGLPKTVNGNLIYDMDPEEMRKYFKAFAATGVAMFGTCCGSDERFVRVLNEEKNCFEEVYDTDGRRPYNTGEESMLPLATERDAFRLPPDVQPQTAIVIDDDFEEKLEAAMESASQLLVVELDSEEQSEIFAELQQEIRKPLCIRCESVTLLEKMLRVYQGRAMYDGAISEAELEKLAKKYGLIY